jgi:hypothetical protein
VYGFSKWLCPDLVQDFKGFQENLEDAMKEVVLMKELNLDASIEGVVELLASYSELVLKF